MNNETPTITACNLRTGRHYKCTLSKGTKCYYVGEVLNYYGKGKHYEYRIHKNTMYVDHLDLRFYVNDCIE